MARIKVTRRRSGEPTNIVGISRCNFPVQRASDGTPLQVFRDNEFASVIQCVESAPGYKDYRAGRGIVDLDEIIFLTYWFDEASIRAFIASESYQSYLKVLGLDEKQTGAVGPALSVAKLIHDFFPTAGIATIYTFGFAYPTAPDIPSDLRGLTPTVPFNIYYPGPLGERKTKYGWILDSQLMEGRLVKKGMTLKTWAPHESLEKQLEVYKAVSEQLSEDWRFKVEALHPPSVDEATWDFSELEEPMSESEPETGLENKLAKIGIQK